MNPKLLKILIAILVAITITGVVAFVLVLNVFGDKKDEPLSLDKMVEYSFTTEEMNTDLQDGSFVQIQFQFMTDSEKAKKEIEQRSFQIKNEFIKQSVSLTEADFKSGLTELESNLKTKMNELMTEGKIIDVYIINKIIQ
ncbi:flagellar basal body-associated FliL family protein [Aquibacillus kalidii]|uniref:flagellar basal body-associated FliL family protein n=1 Tax=Aquibacillus kalidii TaxID=2762597 RepID=UPI001644AE54|nr:flagellar basal body-associated FliL family protein [Aquibacillus kalidii]